MKAEALVKICAQASNAIYGPTANAAKTMAQLGFSNKFVSIDIEGVFKDVCAFVVSSDECHLLVFRGTKTPQDWVTDLACTPVRFEWVFAGAPSIGEIHAGFGHCLAEGLVEIIEALSLEGRDAAKPLVITGHSLGGALAALVGAYFAVAGTPVPAVSAIYTFGQPRIGLHDFCNTYGRILGGKLVRFVNKKDLVPRVPFRGWDYSDEGTMIHFDSTGKPYLQSPEWQNFLVRTLQSLAEFAEMLTHIRADVGDHSMTGYLDAVTKNQDALAQLLRQKSI